MRKAMLVLGGVLSLALAAYAVWVEPYWIEVTRHELPAPVAAPLTIAHLSDLHTLGLGRRERKLLALLEEEKPDLIVVTGDSRSGFGGDNAMVRQTVARLHAPLGVWVVRGNYDGARSLQRALAPLESQGVRWLLNQGRAARPDLWILGLDDFMTGAPDLEAASADVPASAYVIALFHGPATFDLAAGRIDLALAGHTHGGQVRFPFLPPLWLPYGTGDYLEGWYEKNGSRMYVSRGLGTSILPIRFLCRPELAFITLVPSRQGGTFLEE
ncbi:MAG: metallophosphoesterase [Terriglobia bacterium]